MLSAVHAWTGAIVAVGLVAGLAVADQGGEQGGGSGWGRSSMRERTIAEVLSEHSDRLMSVPGVLGVAEGRCDGRPCIKVYVKNKTPQALRKIPSTVGGYPVSIEETNEFRALGR